MLVLLARKYTLPWAPALWQAYSATAHQATPVRLTSQLPGGETQWGGELPARERRALLVRNITVFLNAYQLVLFLSVDELATWQKFIEVIAPAALQLTRELNALQFT
jgi:hypothetical protein